MASFAKAMELDRSHSYAAQSMASIYLKFRDFKKAYDLLKPLSSNLKSGVKNGDRSFFELANGFAVASSYVGENEQALTFYNMILEKDGQNVPVLMNKAIVLVERIKRKKDAEDVLNKLKFLTDDKNIQKKVAELEAQLAKLKG